VSDPKVAIDINRIRDEINNYEATVTAVQAFIDFVARQDGRDMEHTPHSLGRKMNTGPTNVIQPNTEITPDAVVQRSDELGYVLEAKASLPRDQDAWQSDTVQLRKYDDDLTGWWTPTELVRESDVVSLISAPFATQFAEYVTQTASREDWRFRGRVCFVEFSHVVRRKEYIYLLMRGGQIEDHDIAQRLQNGELVSWERLIAYPGFRSFYDSEPPLEYLMVKLWHGIFTEKATDAEVDEQRRRRLVRVHLPALVGEVQALYGSTGAEPRERQYPRRAWIKSALDAFVQLGLAEQNNSEEYVILFYRITGDLVERFARHRTMEAVVERPPADQLPLFDEDRERQGLAH